MIIEINKKTANNAGGVKNAIKNELYMVWTPERIKKAFKNGNGTQKDLQRWMNDNKQFCYFLDVTEGMI